MSRRKSLYSVSEAAGLAFERLPDRFRGYELSALAKAIMARPGCMDGTILRKLRLLRQQDPIRYGYRVVDSDQSVYEKSKLKKAEVQQLKIGN